MLMRCVMLAAVVALAFVGAAHADDTKAPARFLAVTVTAGFRHGSIGTAEPVLEEIGRTSGLFHVDFLRMPPGRLPQPKPPRRGKDTSDADWSGSRLRSRRRKSSSERTTLPGRRHSRERLQKRLQTS